MLRVDIVELELKWYQALTFSFLVLNVAKFKLYSQHILWHSVIKLNIYLLLYIFWILIRQFVLSAVYFFHFTSKKHKKDAGERWVFLCTWIFPHCVWVCYQQPLIGHVTLVAIIGTTVLVPYLLSRSLCNSFEDCAPIDEICGCAIFKWVAVAWWYGMVPG